jgi:hypothetical protein
VVWAQDIGHPRCGCYITSHQVKVSIEHEFWLQMKTLDSKSHPAGLGVPQFSVTSPRLAVSAFAITLDLCVLCQSSLSDIDVPQTKPHIQNWSSKEKLRSWFIARYTVAQVRLLLGFFNLRDRATGTNAHSLLLCHCRDALAKSKQVERTARTSNAFLMKTLEPGCLN